MRFLSRNGITQIWNYPFIEPCDVCNPKKSPRFHILRTNLTGPMTFLSFCGGAQNHAAHHGPHCYEAMFSGYFPLCIWSNLFGALSFVYSTQILHVKNTKSRHVCVNCCASQNFVSFLLFFNFFPINVYASQLYFEKGNDKLATCLQILHNLVIIKY